MSSLTSSQRKEIAEILGRRANEIAGFHMSYTKDPSHFGKHFKSRTFRKFVGGKLVA